MPWTETLRSGRYQALYRTASGERRSAGSFDHKKAAIAAATVAEENSRKVGWRDPKVAQQTWREWAAEWWPTRTVAPGTLKTDAGRRDGRLMPKWGDVRLCDITRHEVKKWAGELRDEGLSPATVQRTVHLLSASLTAAVDAEILPGNVAYRLRLPPADNTKERYLTKKEQGRLLAQFEDDSVDQALVALLLGTGLRWGEAVGLQVKRVDLQRKMLRVAEVWDNKSRELKAYPKSKRRRDVPIPPWVARRIKPLMKNSASGFVFEIDGNVIDYSNWRNRAWSNAIIGAHLDDGEVTIHTLRHTYASMLVQAGRSLEEIGKLLGHLSPLTTQRYSHLAKVASDEVLDALSDPTQKPKKAPKRMANAWQTDRLRGGSGLYRAVDNRASKPH
ncbi:site-specific integrase [Herbiconiux sp.]|uniref:tyrosine-type recombinase/integrase n=1 Tax=Herbiconiux sp. TaxID=1871186 RepID=UPI0025C5BC30|nr:site-specific integrase [Herbiconiux sp.]